MYRDIIYIKLLKKIVDYLWNVIIVALYGIKVDFNGRSIRALQLSKISISAIHLDNRTSF